MNFFSPERGGDGVEIFFFPPHTSDDHHRRDELCKVRVVRLVGPNRLHLGGGEARDGGGDGGGRALRRGEGEGREEEERAVFLLLL